MLKLKLVDGIVSPICLIEVVFIILNEKMPWMLMRAVSFEHLGQMLNWMDWRVSPILPTLFDDCGIQNLSA